MSRREKCKESVIANVLNISVHLHTQIYSMEVDLIWNLEVLCVCKHWLSNTYSIFERNVMEKHIYHQFCCWLISIWRVRIIFILAYNSVCVCRCLYRGHVNWLPEYRWASGSCGSSSEEEELSDTHSIITDAFGAGRLWWEEHRLCVFWWVTDLHACPHINWSRPKLPFYRFRIHVIIK